MFNVDACQLSSDILKNMFSRAEKLVCGQNSICPSRGSVNAKLVESKSGQRPESIFQDSDCPMWKCSKLCSHTIACAYQDGCLQGFLTQVTDAPSFYALSKASTTTKAGKKPEKRKASSKSSTKAFTELREEINQSCSQVHPAATGVDNAHPSLPTCSTTSMIQTPSVSFYQRVHQSTSATSVVVQSPTVTAF